MKTLNLYITEKLKLNKDSQDTGDDRELFEKYDKGDKCLMIKLYNIGSAKYKIVYANVVEILGVDDDPKKETITIRFLTGFGEIDTKDADYKCMTSDSVKYFWHIESDGKSMFTIIPQSDSIDVLDEIEKEMKADIVALVLKDGALGTDSVALGNVKRELDKIRDILMK